MLYFIVILLVFVIGLLCGSECETYKREDVIKKYDSLKELYKVLLDDNEKIKNENDQLRKENYCRPTIVETLKNVLEYEAHRLVDFRELNILKDAVPDVSKLIKQDLLGEILLKMEQDVSLEEEERCDLHGNTYSMKVKVVK